VYRFIVGDTETTGITPEDQVCEVAWVELDEELQVLDRQHSLIDPQRYISHSASGTHGITNADVVDAPTLKEFFDIILGGTYFAPGDKVFLIAHNAAFDARFLGPYMPIEATLCTLRLARRVYPEVENHKLSTLMYALGLTRGEKHRADGDVDTTVDLLRKIVEKTGQTLPELAAASLEPIWVELMPFGKHKGVPLKALPGTYIQWLMKLDNLDRDMRWSLEQLLQGKAP
jgi:exodeoxyribonuclease X